VRRAARRALACGVVAVVATYGLFSCGPRGAADADLPRYDEVRASHVPSDVQLLDRRGEVLHEVRTDPRRRALAWTELGAVSPLLRDAIVAAEDRRFGSHGGVDPLAVAAALRDLVLGRGLRGASTLTMQLATLLDERAGGRRARGVRAKLRQARRARALERAWSKEQILEAYLNLVSFRGEVQGVEAAAGALFGKRPHGLGRAEALVLAASPRAPNAPAAAVAARAERLAARLGVALDPAETSRASAAAAAYAARRPRTALAPHLATRLLRPGDDGRRVPAVRSTLDARLQHAAVRLLEEHLRELAGRNVRDGAVLVADNATGDVLAYVGGRGPRATAPHVDGVRARRQAGSTLKPFLYATALDARLLTAASLLEDAPLALPVAGGVYAPRNYDEAYRGLVSLRAALASSLNVPAVRALALVGPDALAERLRALGFDLRDGGFYGPSLALGSADVTLEELVAGYRALAQGGVATPLRLVADDEAAASGAGTRVLSPEAAFVIADVLADRESRSAAFGLENALATRGWSAVKTGTSKEMRDNWCVGFSTRFTVGVWVGNASGEPMHGVSGLTGAAPLWRDLMAMLHADEPATPPDAPPPLARAAVSFAGGTEPPRGEWFLSGTEPSHARQAPAPRRPRILAPDPDAVLAFDPDVPSPLQRLVFAADAAGPGARWRLDGRELAPADAPLPWLPAVGRHRLELLGADGRVLDRVAFEVRGPRAPG